MPVTRMLPAVLLVYMVLVGGTSIGELHPVVRLITYGIVGGLVIVWIRTAARVPDYFDRMLVISLILFVATGLASQFMRQSFDALWIALGFASALAVGRRALFDPAARRLVLSAMAALSLLLALLTAIRWLPTTVAWVIATGGLAPPLDIEYAAVPWGHRHDMTLLLVMLAPAWFFFVRQRATLLMAFVAWILTAAIVVIDGSRNLWLAIAIASLLAVRRRWGAPLLTRRLVLPLAALGLVVALLISLALADRLLNLRTITARNELWDGSIQAWLATPLTGYGPGSFPWVLQTTDYFATNAWAPRHPDSALFQLLAETGVIGVAAVIVLLMAVVPRLRVRTPSGWALAVFLVAGLGASPTDFGFLVTVAVAWLAMATALPSSAQPVQAAQATWSRPSRGPVAIAAASLLILAGVAQISAVLGEVASWRAGDAIEAGDWDDADRNIELAIALDPSLAFYHRTKGLIDWAHFGSASAIPALREAVRINPSDDLAWRQLAAAQWQAGDDGALQSAEMALLRQRSDVLNILLAAQIASDTGKPAIASSLLAEAVQAWPTLVSGSSWTAYVSALGLDDQAIIDQAIQRWRLGRSSPVPVRTQPIWLVAMGHRSGLREAATDSASEPRQLSEALNLAVTCDGLGALRALADADPSSVYNPLYWRLRVAVTSLPDIADDPQAVAVLGALFGPATDPLPDAADVLAEGTSPGFSIDNWGYRRRAIAVPGLAGSIPLPRADWITDLADAARCQW